MPFEENISERLIVIELSNGNEKAFRSLYDTYSPRVYAYSFSLLKSSANSKEIVQEVFLKIWLNRENLDPDMSFKSFVFTITKNLSFNFLKKVANDNNLREEVFVYRPKSCNPIENQILDKEYEIMRKMAIAQLSPARRKIFMMSREEGKSYQEISSELNISISTVKNQMSKSLDSLKAYLKVNGNLTFFIVLTSSAISRLF
ncbi:ECF RNA polymerase sigma factor SigL [Arenibacter antarcticus]|uniref:RNA polymerase sigma factor n=1 Tax=Arenibacter antarcticus TaxID=2040469 RepID=A0ABW5VI40_9FLAO|nr:RNA polymerase sigma-70 factor [Arenibacter sp. H213]MCM4168100.1 RNA polymerase sigma-70 factor [Arenibacter sp. H213]